MDRLDIPDQGIGLYVADLARRSNVTAVEDALSRMATKFSELSGDEVVLDETERLIVNLARRGVISRQDMLKLHGKYLAESRSINRLD